MARIDDNGGGPPGSSDDSASDQGGAGDRPESRGSGKSGGEHAAADGCRGRDGC